MHSLAYKWKELWSEHLVLYDITTHCRLQSPRSILAAPRIDTSSRPQHRTAKPIFTHWQLWQVWLAETTERVLCACSKHVSGQRSQSLAQTKWIAGSGHHSNNYPSYPPSIVRILCCHRRWPIAQWAADYISFLQGPVIITYGTPVVVIMHLYTAFGDQSSTS